MTRTKVGVTLKMYSYPTYEPKSLSDIARHASFLNNAIEQRHLCSNR